MLLKLLALWAVEILAMLLMFTIGFGITVASWKALIIGYIVFVTSRTIAAIVRDPSVLKKS